MNAKYIKTFKCVRRFKSLLTISFLSVLILLFIRTSKISRGSMFLIFEGLQPQNVLILFLFSLTDASLGIQNFLILLQSRIQLYTPMENLIASQRMTLWVFWSLCIGKCLKEILIIINLFFCFLPSKPQNVLDMFLDFYQFQPHCSCKFGSHKKKIEYSTITDLMNTLKN